MLDVKILYEAVNFVQAEARAEAQSRIQALQEIKKELEDTKTKLNKSITMAEEGKMAAREATEMGRTVTAMLKGMKTTGMQSWTSDHALCMHFNSHIVHKHTRNCETKAPGYYKFTSSPITLFCKVNKNITLSKDRARNEA